MTIPTAVRDKEPHGVHKERCEGFESEHAVTAGICKSWCWGHMECEPAPEAGFYLVCGECFHGFVTADSLLNAHNATSKQAYEKFKGDPVFGSSEEWQATTDVSDVFCCPVCIHDF